MSVRLRLARAGTRKKPYYWIVAADTRMPRDGRFLEKLGTYNPRVKPTRVVVKADRVIEWLEKGAVPSEAVREILRDQGVIGQKKEPAPAEESAG